VEKSLYELEYDPYELGNLIGWPSDHPVAEVLRKCPMICASGLYPRKRPSPDGLKKVDNANR